MKASENKIMETICALWDVCNAAVIFSDNEKQFE